MKKHTVKLEMEFEGEISSLLLVELLKCCLPTNTFLEVPNFQTEMYEDVVIEKLRITFPDELENA